MLAISNEGKLAGADHADLQIANVVELAAGGDKMQPAMLINARSLESLPPQADDIGTGPGLDDEVIFEFTILPINDEVDVRIHTLILNFRVVWYRGAPRMRIAAGEGEIA